MRGCCDAVPRRFLVRPSFPPRTLRLLRRRPYVCLHPSQIVLELLMARAYRLTSNDAIAKECYERVLSLWKEADPDIPIYQIAKAEYAQLQQRAPKVQ